MFSTLRHQHDSRSHDHCHPKLCVISSTPKLKILHCSGEDCHCHEVGCHHEDCHCHEELEIMGIPPVSTGYPHKKHAKWTIENIAYEGRRLHHGKYDYRFIKLEHLKDGSNSKIPVWCKKCRKIFPVSISNHFSNKPCGCPPCSGRERWTSERVQIEGPKLHPTCNYSHVIPEHITNGTYSEIPVFCNVCQKMFLTTINDHLNGHKNGCRHCAKWREWTIERIQDEGPKLHPTCNYSHVIPEHITDGARSEIPVFCNVCRQMFVTAINDHLSGYKSGCSHCSERRAWTIERIQEEGPKLHPTCNYSHVVPEHITDGSRSEIPVFCEICQVLFLTTILEHFYNKTGCIRCSKRERWTAIRVKNEGPELHPSCDYSYVIPEHITDGCDSEIPVFCKKCQRLFLVTIAHHFCDKTGCPPCNSRGYSRAQIEWIEFCMKRDGVFIHHALNGGEYSIPGTRYHVDGYYPPLKKIYEYYGDWWHGNLDKYPRDKMNTKSKKTMGELYDKTIERHKVILEKGYTIEYIWENDWIELKKKLNLPATTLTIAPITTATPMQLSSVNTPMNKRQPHLLVVN